MSYNVDTWNTKELVNLRIPVASLYKHERKDWHPVRKERADGTVAFEVFGDSSVISGKLVGDLLHVEKIRAAGEGSGTSLEWIIEPALRDSTGTLVAVRVWEGGDSIDRLTVIDGVLSVEEIEL